MKAIKILLTIFTLLIVVVSWSLAAWALGLEDYEAPNLMIFLGRFHPLVLHLPIGFMVLALMLDIARTLPESLREKVPNTTALHALIVVSGAGAVFHGILLYAGGGYEGSELAEKHLKGGCLFLTLATGVFLFKLWVRREKLVQFGTAPLTIISMLVMSISAHDGASLTHGENYLSKYAPEFLKPILEPGYKKPAPKDPLPPAATFADENVYAVAIQPIFERVCVSCHDENKSKGKLRMDSFTELMKGGAEGGAVIPGDVDGSLIIARMMLPIDDEYEEHMPPQGKPQHTDEELAILKWWISIGAPSEGALKSHNPPAELLPVIEALER